MRLPFVTLLLFLIGCLCMPSAHATRVSADIVYSIDSPTGASLSRTIVTPIGVDTRLAGWDLSMTIATSNSDGVATQGADGRRRAYSSEAATSQRAARGLTDVRITAERSVQISKKISLDLLARATLPTGRVSRGLGDGRKELMLDAGLSADIGKLSVWAGGARRIRDSVHEAVSGRDINEVYAGTRLELRGSAELRLDYLRSSKEYRGYARAERFSASYQKSLSRVHALSAFVAQDNGPWGKDTRAGVTMTWQARLL